MVRGLLAEVIGLLDHAGQLAANALSFRVEVLVHVRVDVSTSSQDWVSIASPGTWLSLLTNAASYGHRAQASATSAPTARDDQPNLVGERIGLLLRKAPCHLEDPPGLSACLLIRIEITETLD